MYNSDPETKRAYISIIGVRDSFQRRHKGDFFICIGVLIMKGIVLKKAYTWLKNYKMEVANDYRRKGH